MPFHYYDRLSAKRKRIYRRSDGIATLDIPVGLELGLLVLQIQAELAGGRRSGVQKSAQQLVARLIAGYRVPRVTVRVLAARPVNDYEELHGLYEPEDDDVLARISVWMRTAQRRQVVAFRTFLRTLIHELCHHLDYELYALEETFHTEGFYKRESSLVNALIAQAGAHESRPPAKATIRAPQHS